MICTAPFCTVLEVDRDVVLEISQNLKSILEEKYNLRHKYLSLKLNSKINEKRKFKILYNKDLVGQKLEKNKDYMIENKIIIRRVYREVKKDCKYKKIISTSNEFRPKSVSGTRIHNTIMHEDDLNLGKKLKTKQRFQISAVPFNKSDKLVYEEEPLNPSDKRHISNMSCSQSKCELLVKQTNEVEFTPKVEFNFSLPKKQDDCSNQGSRVYFRKSSVGNNLNITSVHSSMLIKEQIPSLKQKVKVKLELRDLIHNKVGYKKILDDWSNQKASIYSSGSYKLPLFSNLLKKGGSNSKRQI